MMLQVTSGQGSLDIIVNTAEIKRLGDNDVVGRKGCGTHEKSPAANKLYRSLIDVRKENYTMPVI